MKNQDEEFVKEKSFEHRTVNKKYLSKIENSQLVYVVISKNVWMFSFPNQVALVSVNKIALQEKTKPPKYNSQTLSRLGIMLKAHQWRQYKFCAISCVVYACFPLI